MSKGADHVSVSAVYPVAQVVAPAVAAAPPAAAPVQAVARRAPQATVVVNGITVPCTINSRGQQVIDVNGVQTVVGSTGAVEYTSGPMKKCELVACLIFGLGWMLPAIWPAGFCLVCRNPQTPCGKRLNIGSTVMGVFSIVVCIIVGGLVIGINAQNDQKIGESCTSSYNCQTGWCLESAAGNDGVCTECPVSCALDFDVETDTFESCHNGCEDELCTYWDGFGFLTDWDCCTTDHAGGCEGDYTYVQGGYGCTDSQREGDSNLSYGWRTVCVPEGANYTGRV